MRLTCTFSGDTWYVSSKGLDSNPCRSADAPCQYLSTVLQRASTHARRHAQILITSRTLEVIQGELCWYSVFGRYSRGFACKATSSVPVVFSHIHGERVHIFSGLCPTSTHVPQHAPTRTNAHHSMLPHARTPQHAPTRTHTTACSYTHAHHSMLPHARTPQHAPSRTHTTACSHTHAHHSMLPHTRTHTAACSTRTHTTVCSHRHAHHSVLIHAHTPQRAHTHTTACSHMHTHHSVLTHAHTPQRAPTRTHTTACSHTLARTPQLAHTCTHTTACQKQFSDQRNVIHSKNKVLWFLGVFCLFGALFSMLVYLQDKHLCGEQLQLEAFYPQSTSTIS